MISKKIFIVPFAAVVLLGGCADQRISPNGKTGWVTELYTTERLKMNRPSCLANLSDLDIASGRYALVTTTRFRGYRYVSVLVPNSVDVQLDDKVEISSPSCDSGVLPEVVQVLDHSARSHYDR